MERQRPWVVLAAVAALLLAVVATSAGPVTLLSDHHTPEPFSYGSGAASDTSFARPSTAKTPGESHPISSWFVALLLTPFLLLGLVVLCHWELERRRRRLDEAARFSGLLAESGTARDDPELAAEQLADAVDSTTAALSTGEPRNAIVACWLSLEETVAGIGTPRHSAETSLEFTERVIGLLAVDEVAIARLADLYREARFSSHAMNESHRAEAITSLDQLFASLRRRVQLGSLAP